MRILLFIILLFISVSLVKGEAYELHLQFKPDDASVEFKLRHPFNDSTNNPNYGIYKDCDKVYPDAEWGLASYNDDNPKLIINSIVGGSKITASQLNDPGNCSPVVSINHGAATCTVEIVNWPGVETGTFTKIMSVGDPEWVITSLPCADDMGLLIIKAKQKNSFKLRIKAEFAALDLLEKDKSIFQASLESSPESQLWMNFDSPHLNKVNKAGTVGRFGKPVKAVVKNKNAKKQKLILNDISKKMYKNDILNVFVTFNNGWSGFEQIELDDKGKYNAP